LAGKLNLSRLSIFIIRSKIVHSPHLAYTPVAARAIPALISISISISTTYKRANLAGKLDVSRLSIFIIRSKIVHSPHLAYTPVAARAIPALITVPDFLALRVLLPRQIGSDLR
jgi:hypothetical protein